VSDVLPDRGADFREELIERALSLPLGDQAALNRVARLCDEETASVARIALDAGRDESFAALLLRMANSAYSASVSRVADLPTAIARLGLRRIQALALAAPGMRLLHGPPDGLGPARHELHRHAIRVGVVARALAPSGVDPERALAAGILHNLGLNVVALYAPDEFRHLLAAAERGEQLWQTEEPIFGFSHAELGAVLAERWSYPLDLVVAIRDHDGAQPETLLAQTVQAADLLVRSFGVGIEAPRPLEEAVHLPGLDLERARARVEELVAAQDRFDEHVHAA
jgi:HD-like signal output (HDOD) protein